MNNTALGAKKVLFISEAHENFYNEKLNMVRYKDVLTKCLSEGWQTSGSKKVVRMAINLYCNGTPSTEDYKKSEDKLEECKAYTVEDLFCCAYAPFFWQAIQIRYPEYASYNFKLKELFGGED